MGMHLGFIAIKCSIEELREAFLRASAHYVLKTNNPNLGDAFELDEWMQKFEKKNTNVFFFFDDGPYAILMDFRQLVTCDQELLADLSSNFGTVLSFAIETAGGCAYFWCFEDGKLRRYIGYVDGILEKKGKSLSQEQGLAIRTCYYMKETRELWDAFGLSPYERMTHPPIEGVCLTNLRIEQ